MNKIYIEFLAVIFSVSVMITPGICEGKKTASADRNWFQNCFYNWFMTHHVRGTEEVGKDIDVKRIKNFLRKQDPDYIGVHARGPMGWALYPAETGYTLPKLRVDLVSVFSEIAEDLNKPLLIYYNLGRDMEIQKRRPEWNRIDVKGDLYPMSLSYLTDVKEKYLWPQIREIMTKYEPDAFWLDGSVYSVWPCFRKETKAKFKKVTGKDAPESEDSPLWNEYREFHRRVWREFTDETTDMIHKIDPNCLVSYNMAYTVWMPEKPDEDVDFTTMDLGHLTEDISLVTRFTDTQGIPFEILLPIRFFLCDYEKLIKPMGQMKQDIAQVIANGGILGVWDQPGETTEFLPGHQERLIKLSRWVHKRKKWCHDTISLPDASVLHIAESHYLPDERFEKFPNSATGHFCYPHENVRVRGACYGLNRHHVHNSVIAGWRLKQGPVTAQLLVVEDPKVIPSDISEAIADFAEIGGTVLLTATAAEDSRIAELAGIEITNSAEKGRYCLAHIEKKRKVKFKHELTVVKAVNAEVVRTVSKNNEDFESPFLTKRTMGKGKIYYCAAPVFTEYSFTDIPDELREDILDVTLPKESRKLVVKGPASIEVSLRKKGSMQLIHLVNKAKGNIQGKQHTKKVTDIPQAPPCRLSLKLEQKPISVKLQPGSRNVSWSYEKGRAEIDVPGFEMYEIIEVNLPGK